MRRRGNLRRNKITKPKRDLKKIAIPLGIVALIVLFFSIIFSLINIGNRKIINGVKIGNIDVSNLTQEEAIEKINAWKKDIVFKDIDISYEDYEESINVEQFNPKIETDRLVRKACNIGKTGNIIKDNYEILLTSIFSKSINLDIKVDEEKLNKKIVEINSKLPGTLEESNYYIEDNNLIIKKGKAGIVVDEDNFKDEINSKLINTNKEIKLKVINRSPSEINIEKIYNEIHKEVQNAYISQDPTEVHPEVNGVDFDISIEEAKKSLEEEKEEYIIPLKITLAEVTLDDIGKEAFPNLLGKFSTTYNVENENRSTNLKLAAEKIDGTIVLPGEEFSYNKVVGQRTIAAGYKEAAVYSGGKVVDGIGGGICQISSTLYNAVLYANLEVTERSNHRFLTSYVEAGRDATVSWGTLDFCFENTRNYPIKVVTSVKYGVVTAEIYGTYEEKEYEIEIQNDLDEVLEYETTYVKDYTLDEGIEEVKQNGSNGAISTTYKITKYNGAEVSREILSSDTYSPLEKIVKKGMKKTTETSAPMFADGSEDEEENEEEILTKEINPELLELIKEL
ncbi:MAG: VanW family protein [Clostridia bacterium]|nr:VanW family protein [Clostridia bacterium]